MKQIEIPNEEEFDLTLSFCPHQLRCDPCAEHSKAQRGAQQPSPNAKAGNRFPIGAPQRLAD
jgi:hypothetical protein